MIIRLKCFYDSLNIVVVLPPGCKFLSIKCTQFPLIFTKLHQMMNILARELLLFISEKKLLEN